MPSVMDTHFISFIEMKEEGVKFKRIDSTVDENVQKDAEEDAGFNEKLADIFKNALGDDNMKIEVKPLKQEETSAVILLSEESRRMQEMYRSYGQQFAGMSDMFKDELTLVINSNNSIIKKIETLGDEEKNMVCHHVYDLAMLCHKPLSPEKMTEFVKRSNEIMEKVF